MNTNNIEMKQTPFAAMNEPHLPVLFLFDTSGSMQGQPLAELVEGYNRFLAHMTKDDLAMKRVDLAVMTFSGVGGVKLLEDFKPLSHISEFSSLSLTAEGNTPMGEAITRAVQIVRERCRVYDEAGIPRYVPHIFMITDGESTDDITQARELLRERDGRLKFFCVAVNNANTDVLKSLSPRVMQCMKENEFSHIFDWLGSSMSIVSASRVGENPQLPNLPDNFRVVPTDW